ncbi:short-chain dehydrogenase/reductase family 16C member 6-like isoform X2 [Coccinella septempunctata]|uniref:short-chain dehydrogenase/reductase family 16C member 6-like isoform X2 n=1 Tax=Coccinella septempunctata TaxID=41139 RepID=UPI001D086659|nr:short-chain dehydrogenase/reductase family 16C member 6-like isoform X2 [Coccinella septempunctata]
MSTHKIPREKKGKSKPHPSEVAFQGVEISVHILIWILQVFYYVLEDIYRLFRPKKLKPVDKEIVLITGAGHGIGRELAFKYAQAGATVVGWDLCEENNAKTIKEINEKFGKKAYAYTCDVSNLEEIKITAEKVKRDVGDVTILIANAGILYIRHMQDYSPIEIKKMIDTNVMQLLWLLHVYLPVMTANNYGHIVGISSIAGLIGAKNMIPYVASKFAVRGIMEGLLDEIRVDKSNKIKTTVVYPYMVDTGLFKISKSRFPLLMRILKPEKVANSIIMAQRAELEEVSIPGSMRPLNNLVRILPRKAYRRLLDLLDTSVEPDPIESF